MPSPQCSNVQPAEQAFWSSGAATNHTPVRGLPSAVGPVEPLLKVHQTPCSKSIRPLAQSPSDPLLKVHQTPCSKSIRTLAQSPSDPLLKVHQNPCSKSIRPLAQSPSDPLLKVHITILFQVGYCQGMSSIAGMLLMIMPAEQAFWCLVSIMDKYLPGYFSDGLLAIQLDGM